MVGVEGRQGMFQEKRVVDVGAGYIMALTNYKVCSKKKICSKLCSCNLRLKWNMILCKSLIWFVGCFVGLCGNDC